MSVTLVDNVSLVETVLSRDLTGQSAWNQAVGYRAVSPSILDRMQLARTDVGTPPIASITYDVLTRLVSAGIPFCGRRSGHHIGLVACSNSATARGGAGTPARTFGSRIGLGRRSDATPVMRALQTIAERRGGSTLFLDQRSFTGGNVHRRWTPDVGRTRV